MISIVKEYQEVKQKVRRLLGSQRQLEAMVTSLKADLESARREAHRTSQALHEQRNLAAKWEHQAIKATAAYMKLVSECMPSGSVVKS